MWVVLDPAALLCVGKPLRSGVDTKRFTFRSPSTLYENMIRIS